MKTIYVIEYAQRTRYTFAFVCFGCCFTVCVLFLFSSHLL